MAGHGGGNIFQLAGQTACRIPFGDLIGQLPNEPLNIDFAQHGWRFANRDRARSETLDGKPHLVEAFRMLHQSVAILFRKIDNFRDKQHLRSGPFGVQRLAHLLEDEPLMRGMLIDDHQPVLGLGNDVIGMHLRARCPQWIARRLEGSSDRLSIRVKDVRPGRRHGDVDKLRLRRFAQSQPIRHFQWPGRGVGGCPGL